MSLYFLSTSTTSVVDSIDISDAAEGVVSMAEAISEYGFVVVIMAIFLLCFLGITLLMLRNNSKMMDSIIKDQETSNNADQEFISKFLENALQEKNNIEDLVKGLQDSLKPIEDAINCINDAKDQQEYHKDLVGSYIDVNMAFKDASRKALTDLNCERVAIYVFHNGNQSLHGLPFFKMSCIHEWTNRGSNTLRGKAHTDLPLHMFNDFIEDLWIYGLYRLGNISKCNEDKNEAIKEFVAYSNVKSMYIIGLKDDNNILSGFIVAEFNKEDTFEVDEARDNYVKNVILSMASKVSTIVTHKYIYIKDK